MRVLVACEFSGIVRDAFRARGHDAWSCDLRPSRGPGSTYHLHGDVRIWIEDDWELLIAHPPCTHLAGSGARWLTDHWVTCKTAPSGRYWWDGSAKRAAQTEAVRFIQALWNAPVPRKAIENPVGVLPRLWRKWDQRFDPFNFGDPYRKATCLWLENLPPLRFTSDLTTGAQACWRMPPGPEREVQRSLTYPGVAAAMAMQWGNT